MAWSSVGSWATANSTSSSSSLQIFRPASTTPVGDVLVLTVSADNVQTTTGDSALVTGITDNSGNTWVKVSEYTYSAGSAGDGTTCSVWILPVTTQVSSGGSVTVQFASAITAKAGHIRQMRATGTTITVADVQVATVVGGDAPSISISGLTSQEYLFWRSIGSERNATGLTPTTNYTAGGAVTANTGTLATSQAAVTEFRILTATGDTSNPGHGPSDQVGIYFALSDVDPVIDIPTAHTALAPAGRLPKGKLSRKSGWFDFTMTHGDSGAAPVAGEGGEAKTMTLLPPKKRAPLHVSNLGVYRAPLSSDVDTQSLGNGVRRTELPVLGRPPLPMGFCGWMNRNNEVAMAARSFSLPPAGRDRNSYDGFNNFTIYDDNFDYACARQAFDVPPGRDMRDYSGFLGFPLSDDSVEAKQPGIMFVPPFRDRNSYDGWTQATVCDDINEWLEKVTALPPVGADRTRWVADGLQLTDVVMRDETGVLVEYRGSDAHWSVPPAGRDRNSYDGFMAMPPIGNVEPATTGFTYDALPPSGADRRDYSGFQHRSDFEQLRETPIAGFTCDALPPIGSFYRLYISAYQGYKYLAVPPDLIPEAGKIWRPIYRPRRR